MGRPLEERMGAKEILQMGNDSQTNYWTYKVRKVPKSIKSVDSNFLQFFL